LESQRRYLTIGLLSVVALAVLAALAVAIRRQLAVLAVTG
jgi:hypothetical protein